MLDTAGCRRKVSKGCTRSCSSCARARPAARPGAAMGGGPARGARPEPERADAALETLDLRILPSTVRMTFLRCVWWLENDIGGVQALWRLMRAIAGSAARSRQGGSGRPESCWREGGDEGLCRCARSCQDERPRRCQRL